MAGKEMDPLLFPGFRLIVEIASGESGTIWRARELDSQRLVALKLYRPELLRRTGFSSALAHAVVAARNFEHPVAARVHGLVEAKSGGGLALIGELVGGEVLGRALQRNVRFAPARALGLAGLLSDALSAAHIKGLSAGSLHPGHVVVAGEAAKLLGLGTSPAEGLPLRYEHAPEEGRFAPAVYAAPEVLSGHAPDARSDMFALGALLYHMLTGLCPFRARDLTGLKLERAEGLRWPRGADSAIPAEALGLVGRSLELDPALRPSASDFSAAAARILSGEPRTALGAGAATPESSGATAQMAGDRVLAPAEPQALPATTYGHSRIRDLAMGAVAATLLLSAGVLLGRFAWRTPGPAPTQHPQALSQQSPPAAVQQPAANPPTAPAGPAAPSPEEAAARREYEAVMAILAGNPSDLAPIKERLKALSQKSPASEWGLRAGLKLAELAGAERSAQADRYRKLLDQAAEAEKRERFGEAAGLLEQPPGELAGGEFASRSTLEAVAVRKRAAERYDLVARRAERSVADGDLAAAMLDYKRVAEDFGIPELVAAASKRLGELGRIQEQNAQEAARVEAERRRERAAASLRQALESVRAQLLLFRYAKALEVLSTVATDKDQSDEARKLLAGYSELVRGERKLFELASRRVANGIRELNITVGDSEVLTIKKLDEKGLLADGEQISGVVFTWERLNASSLYQAYLAVKKTIDLTSSEEQLALATCAFHHDQEMEVKNCLKVAAELDPAARDAAAAQAEIYRQVQAVLQPRRAAAPGGDSPRRTPAEAP